MELDNSDDLDGMQRRITELSGQLRTCNAGQQAGHDGARQPSPTVGTATVRPTTTHNQGSVADKTLPERWPEKAKQGKLVYTSRHFLLMTFW